MKPANFAFDPTINRWILIDFGLAKRYVDSNGTHVEPTAAGGFRGSTTYASINAHLGSEQSRRDDLWSWLYMVLESYPYCGTLPWRRVSKEGTAYSKQRISEYKQDCVKDPLKYFGRFETPWPFVALNGLLDELSFST